MRAPNYVEAKLRRSRSKGLQEQAIASNGSFDPQKICCLKNQKHTSHRYGVTLETRKLVGSGYEYSRKSFPDWSARLNCMNHRSS